MATTAETLQLLEDKIHALVNDDLVQSVTWNGLTYTRYNLTQLIELKEKLQVQLAAQSSQSPATAYYEFGVPS